MIVLGARGRGVAWQSNFTRPPMRLSIGVMFVLFGVGGASPTSRPSIVLSPCPIKGADEPVARCGTYRVFEDRERHAGRTIPLSVYVLPSKSPTPSHDPVMFVSRGGPGTTNTDVLAGLSTSWWRETRDVIVIDLRGTSGESRLDCTLPGSDDHPEGYLSSLFPAEAIRACRDTLSRKADLRFYNTTEAVDDLDEVREALGYERVNLWGASWGTRAVLLYLRRHPASVRTAIVEGVAPTSLKNPLPHARSAQDALDSLFEECGRKLECHQAFPNPTQELSEVLTRLKQQPATVTVRGSGDSVQVRLTWQQFAEALRVMSYYPPTAVRIPLVIHEAFDGDLSPFAETGIAGNRGLRSQLRFGFLLSVTCTEDVPRIEPGEIERATANTYLGDSRVREQMRACADWIPGPLDAHYGDPVRSNVPVFLLSGRFDPVSPPRFAANAARYLPNSIHVVAPGGHVPTGPCVTQMERAFLTAGSAKAVDTSCVASMRYPAFALPPG
jgi:pimeloyl-ACP methyl ester carboxylesterase